MIGARYLLVFSRAGCPYCRQALPELDRALRSIPRVTLPRWVISESIPDSIRGRSGLEIPFATTSTPWSRFGVRRVPSLVLVDESGRVQRIWTGTEDLGGAIAFLAGLSPVRHPKAAGLRPIGSAAGCATCEAP